MKTSCDCYTYDKNFKHYSVFTYRTYGMMTDKTHSVQCTHKAAK